tara:strand:+ start:2297 stop:2515 length:219 start_codon:yes stop_codon:yes gene_type:complete
MIYLDLNGPEGNSFNIMSIAKKLCKALEIDSTPIINDMRSGDYEHLIDVFLKHFDDFVVLSREDHTVTRDER